MDTLAFFRKVLPASGYYVIGRICPGQTWFTHDVCSSLEEAVQYAANYDAQGLPTYHACAAYREQFVETPGKDGKTKKQIRVHKNVRALKSFWMDLDVEAGNEKKYQSQEEAIDGLLAFCETTKLPLPLIVDSGYGVHVYWTLNEEISFEAWRQTAESLKTLAAKLGFKSDPACTSDAARVLRPVGTHNRKDATLPRAVTLVADSAALAYVELRDAVLAGLARIGVKPPEVIRSVPKQERLNEQFDVGREFPPGSAKKIADKCAQLAEFRDKKGVISEPHWYAGIQLMCHTTEGDELIHEWSSGHQQYSREETDRKIAQIRNGGMGPTTCATFDSRNPGKCENCPFYKKLTSPIQLGTEIKRAEPPKVLEDLGDGSVPVEVVLPDVPSPFSRGKDGCIWVEEDGITHKVHEYDLYPVAIERDESLNYETIRIKHFLPKEGWNDFTVRGGLLYKPAEFASVLGDNHVHPVNSRRLHMYIDSYAKALRASTEIRKLMAQQGWKTGGSFVLGNKLFKREADGSVKVLTAGISGKTREYLSNFCATGSFNAWYNMTTMFNRPGLEGHGLMIGLGFSAPLVHLAGMHGYMVSALGNSGTGKTTMAKVMMSIWGNHHTFLTRDTTRQSLLSRVGALNCLPAYVDELTTFEPKVIRELAYGFTSGESRARNDRNGVPIPTERWDTVLVTSTNDSIYGKLRSEKPNAEAEQMRVFEFHFPADAEFMKNARALHPIIEQNHGVVGERWIALLVKHQEQIKVEVLEYIARFHIDANARDQERYWVQACALACYALDKAYEWELINFDPGPVRTWIIAEMARVRGNVIESHQDASEVIGEYLNQTFGERLVVSKMNIGHAANKLPHQRISSRYESDKKLMWIAEQPLKKWLAERHYNYDTVRDELQVKGTLIGSKIKKYLGAGVEGADTDQVRCWKMDSSKLKLEEEA